MELSVHAKAAVKELGRIVKPFDVATVLAALAGTETVFDVDGIWRAHYHGPPREAERRDAFDESALVAGAVSVCYLNAQLPVGDLLLAALPPFVDKLRQRLANDELLLSAGLRADMPTNTTDALHEGAGYWYYRPARLTAEVDKAALVDATWPEWNVTFPWTSSFFVWRYLHSDKFAALMARQCNTPVPDGQWEANPVLSAPQIVDHVQAAHNVSADAAALYLQLLCLCDCKDSWLRLVNGWSKAHYNKVATELTDQRLVVSEAKPRAGRRHTLPGYWESLRSPHPGIEQSKLPLFEAAMMSSGTVAAPLGRIVALQPLHVLFRKGWERIQKAPAARLVVTGKGRTEFLTEIASDPNNDDARLVYADWLSEQGDPRGEFIVVQTQLARWPASEVDTPDHIAVRAREAALLAAHDAQWTARLRLHAADCTYDRGFIVGVETRPQDFAKHGTAIVADAPLLHTLTLRMGGRKIRDANLDALTACPSLRHIATLDFGLDHYPSSRAFVRLVNSDHLGPLSHLSVGPHAKGSGVGITGLRALAKRGIPTLCHLHLPGQRIGDAGAELLATAPAFVGLKTLILPFNSITDTGARALLDSSSLTRLTSLELGNHVDAACTGMFRIRENQLSDAMLERLAARFGDRPA